MSRLTSPGTTLFDRRRAIGSVGAVVVLALLAAFVITSLHNRAERLRRAEIATEQVRSTALADTAIELYTRQAPAAAAILDARAETHNDFRTKALADLRRFGGDALADQMATTLGTYRETLRSAVPDGRSVVTSSAFITIARLFTEIDRTRIALDRQALRAERDARFGTYGSLLLTGALLGLFGFWSRVHRRRAGVLEVAVTTDPLTGLRSRRAFDAELAKALASGSPTCLVLLDLDHFKDVNDRLGHDGGDTVLAAVASRLAPLARIGDCLARWGGEEFAWLLVACDEAEARRAAVRACEAIRAEPVAGVAMTVSAGVAAATPGDDAITLYRKADHALYGAKTSGRDRAHVHRSATATV